jgi:catechol 2,3-dioxygenase-like lactoylglutathione lyase family enzyme
MQVSLTGVSLHVKDIQQAKEFYLRIPGASLDHERGDFFASIRIGAGRVNLVRVNREEKFHLEFGSDDLDSLRAKLDCPPVAATNRRINACASETPHHD